MKARVDAAEYDDALGVWIRVWMEDDAVEETENRRVHTDPERKAHDSDGGEPAILEESANGVAKVLQEHGGLYEPPVRPVRHVPANSCRPDLVQAIAPRP